MEKWESVIVMMEIEKCLIRVYLIDIQRVVCFEIFFLDCDKFYEIWGNRKK